MELYEGLDGNFWLDKKKDKRMVKHFEQFGGHSLNDKAILKQYISPNSNIVDIGAHVGTFSIPLSRFAHHVYAFEPTSDTADYLEKNIKENNVKNISVHRIVVGEKKGRAVGKIGGENRGQTYYADDEAGGIPIVPLEEVVKEFDVLKIDAEGMELRILKGSEQLLRKTRPVLFIEFSRGQLKRYGDNVFGLFSFLYRMGYRTYYNAGHAHDTNKPKKLKKIFLPFFVFTRRNHDILAIPKELPQPNFI